MLTGRAWSFADGLRASDVLPIGASNEPPAGATRSLFAAIDPTLAARLAPGDVLLTVDGAHVGSMKEARAKLQGPITDDVLLGVRRGGQALTLRVTRESVRR